MNLQRENLCSKLKMNTHFPKRRTAFIIAFLHLLFGVNAGKHTFIFIFRLTSYFNKILEPVDTLSFANWRNKTITMFWQDCKNLYFAFDPSMNEQIEIQF